MDVLFEGGVVALFGVVEVDEEEDVGPDVMLLVDVVLKTLQQNTVARCTVQRRCPFFVNEICYFWRFNFHKKSVIVRAGLTTVLAVSWEGAPPPVGPRSTANFLPRCFDVSTFQRLNVTTTTAKKVVNFWGKRSAPSEKKVHVQRKSFLRVCEKGPRLTLVWGPRMVNPVLVTVILDNGRRLTANEKITK